MKSTLLFLGFFLHLEIICQNLTSFPFDLNPGGYVTDVAYFKPSNSYIIVGNFTSVNGVSRHNIAFLNESLSQLQSYNPILSSDDFFQTIAVYNDRIFIGGNFSSLSANTSLYNGSLGSDDCLFEMKFTNNLEFVNRNWNIVDNFSPYEIHGVNDLEIYGDSLIIAGSFARTAAPFYNNLIYFNLTTNVADPNFASQTQGSNGHITDINKKGNFIYYNGYNTFSNLPFSRTDLNGIYDNTFTPNIIQANNPVPFYTNSNLIQKENLIINGIKHNASRRFGYYNLNGNLAPTPNLPVLSGEISDLQVYKDFIIRSQSGYNQIHSYLFNSGTISQGWSLNTNPSAFNNYDCFKGNIFMANNYLFVSTSGLQSIDGQTRIGLGIICLEPYYMTKLTDSANASCPGQSIRFRIDSVQYAHGYKWSYSGNGASIGGTDITNGGTNFIGADKNDIIIDFDANFTPGNLSVRAFSLYGEPTTDSTSISIAQLPLPSITPIADTSITCFEDTINLNALSIPPNATFGWYDFQSIFSNSTDIDASIPGQYIFEVTDQNECKNFDTVTVGIDTIQPDHQTSHSYYQLSCQDTSITLYTSSTTPQTNSYWKYNFQIYPDSIEALLPGQYTSISENLLNGCKDSTITLIEQNFAPPIFQIDGYSNINMFGALDTINCTTNSIPLIASEATQNHTTYWTDSNFTNLGQILIVDAPGIFQLFAQNDSTGCSSIKQISIAIDTLKPYIYTDSTLEINCSLDSTIIKGTVFGINYITWWKDPNGLILNDSSLISSPGDFFFFAEDTINGCIDSTKTLIIRTNSIDFQTDSVIICPIMEQEIGISPISNSPLNYHWSTGETDSSILISLNELTQFQIHTYNADSSCYGTLELIVNPIPKPEINYSYAQSCINPEYNSLYFSVSNGHPPYSYSSDSISWQTTNNFDSLTGDKITLYILDSLGCSYSYPINEIEAVQQMDYNFLMSTYNQVFDTIYIDPIIFPSPDSTNWYFENSPNIFNLEFDKIAIQYLDTGTYNIEMLSYLDGCEHSKTKTIYIREVDTSKASINNNNSIKSLTTYPNPASDQVFIDVEFYKYQNCTIRITDFNGSEISSQFFQKTDNINANFNLRDLNLATGSYLIEVTGEFDTQITTLYFTP